MPQDSVFILINNAKYISGLPFIYSTISPSPFCFQGNQPVLRLLY